MGKVGSAASTAASRRKAPSVAADAAPQKRRRSQKSPQEGGSKASSSSCLKCLKCGRLSSATPWFECQKIYDKKQQGVQESPVGNRCRECGDLHAKAFSHLSWEGFSSMAGDEVMAMNVKEAEGTKSGTPRGFAATNVYKGHGVALEVRSSGMLLNQAELKKRLGTSRLPKNMKSVPRIKVPKMLTDPLARARGETEWEDCFVFRDPQQPHRTAQVVQTFGVASETSAMSDQMWSRQPESVMQTASGECFEKTDAMKLVEGHKALQDLGEFVDQKTQLKAKKTAKGEAQADDAAKSFGPKLVNDGGVVVDSASEADRDADSDDDPDDEDDEEGAESEDDEGLGDGTLAAQDTPLKPGSAKSPSVAGTKSPGTVAPSEGGRTARDVDGDDTRLTGDELVSVKKQKLPLQEIMVYEKKGGWGRSLNGAKSGAARLQQSKEHQHKALDLLAHVDLAQKARKLQPAGIAGVPDCELEDILRSLLKAGVALHPQTQATLIMDRSRRTVDKVMKAAAVDAGKMFDELVNLMTPWRCGGVDVGEFDPLDPKMAALSETDFPTRVDKYEQCLIKEVLLSLMGQGKDKSDFARTFCESIINSYKDVDMLQLGAREAEALTNTLEIARALQGLLGGLMEALEAQSDIEALRDAQGTAVGQSLISLVAQATTTNAFYKGLLDEFFRAQPALVTVAPMIKEHEAALDGGGKPGSLKTAACLLVEYAGSVPEQCFVGLRKLVEGGSVKYWNLLRFEVQKLMKVGPLDDGMAQKLKDWSTVLTEVTLAFPLASWVHDMTEEAASTLRASADQGFNNELATCVQKLKGHLETEPRLPPETAISELHGILSRAAAGHHFRDSASQACIVGCIDSFVANVDTTLDVSWLRMAEVMIALEFFLKDPADPTRRGQVKVVAEAVRLRKVLADAGSMVKGTAWKDMAIQVISKKQALADLAKSLDGDGSDAEVQQRLQKGAMSTIEQADGYIKGLRDCVATKIGEESKNFVDEHKPFAKGSSANDGRDWYGDKSLNELKDFAELLAMWEQTLKIIKPSLFKAGLKTAEGIMADAKKANEIFNDHVVDMKGLTGVYKDLAITKLNGVLLRVCSKKDAELETVRAQVKGEIQDCTKRMELAGVEDFAYTAFLPAGLRKEVADIVSMTRKRR